MRFVRIFCIGVKYIASYIRLKFVVWELNNAFDELEGINKELSAKTVRGNIWQMIEFNLI